MRLRSSTSSASSSSRLFPGRQLTSKGFERHFALEKRSQPLDGRLLDDCQPDPPVLRAGGSIERLKPMLRQVK